MYLVLLLLLQPHDSLQFLLPSVHLLLVALLSLFVHLFTFFYRIPLRAHLTHLVLQSLFQEPHIVPLRLYLLVLDLQLHLHLYYPVIQPRPLVLNVVDERILGILQLRLQAVFMSLSLLQLDAQRLAVLSDGLVGLLCLGEFISHCEEFLLCLLDLVEPLVQIVVKAFE